MESNEYLREVYYEFHKKYEDNSNISLHLNDDVLKPENKKEILGEIEVMIDDNLYREKMRIVESLSNKILRMRRNVLV